MGSWAEILAVYWVSLVSPGRIRRSVGALAWSGEHRAVTQ